MSAQALRREQTCQEIWQGLHAGPDELDVGCYGAGGALSQGMAICVQIIQDLKHLSLIQSVCDCVHSFVIAIQ